VKNTNICSSLLFHSEFDTSGDSTVATGLSQFLSEDGSDVLTFPGVAPVTRFRSLYDNYRDDHCLRRMLARSCSFMPSLDGIQHVELLKLRVLLCLPG